jgi:glycerol-3-phosphate acyltransferase PlsY
MGVATQWLYGEMLWYAPWVGLISQLFWVTLALQTRRSGLLAATAVYTITHAINAWKWWGI